MAMAFLISLFVLAFDRNSSKNQIFTAGIGFSALWFVFMLIGPWFSSLHQFRNAPSAQSPINLDISETGLEVHSAHGDSKVSWAAYVAWSERKSVFIILPQPRIYVPIPKRAFTEQQLTEFREVLQRNVGNRDRR
jgi:hypothetical protein